jgi:hypothetical protein
VAEECGGPQAVRFDPNARAYEAFNLGRGAKDSTILHEPLSATVLDDALAETTQRWSWDRGDRLGIREIGAKVDRLHVYAVRRKSAANYTYRDYAEHREFARWLDHICTIDLNIIAGIDVIGVGGERDMFEHRQRRRPEGARR